MRIRALNKDIYREFTVSITRFLSIMMMIALGSFVFVGLSVTGPTMRNTILTYTNTYRLGDMTVSSPFGLDKEDQEIFASISGVEILDYAYRADLMIDDSYMVVRIESLGQLPGYELIEGRLPDKRGEIVLDELMAEEGYRVGDQISFLPEKDEDNYNLKDYNFVIVGFINSPEYLTPYEKGSSPIGAGVVDFFGVILEDDFNMENYSLARLTFDDVQKESKYSSQYRQMMNLHVKEVEELLASRPEARLNKYLQEGNRDISSAEEEISEATQELLNAQVELDDARDKLDKAWADYEEGKATFDKEIEDAQLQISKAETELEKTKDKLDYGYTEIVEGEQELSQSKAELSQGEAQLAKAKLQLDQGKARLESVQKEINQARSELKEKMDLLKPDESLAALNQGIKMLENSLTDVNKGLNSIYEALSQLSAQTSFLESQLNDVDTLILSSNEQLTVLMDRKTQLELKLKDNPRPELKAELDNIIIEISQIEASLTGLQLEKNNIIGAKDELAGEQRKLLESKEESLKNKAELEGQHKDLLSQKEKVLAGISQLDEASTLLDISQKKLDQEIANLELKKMEYEEGLAELESGRRQVNQGETQLKKAQEDLAAGQVEYENGMSELKKAKNKLASERLKGENELEDAYSKLLEAEEEYEKGLNEYLEKLPEAREDIEQAKKDISKARKALEGLKIPAYSVSHPYKDMGFSQYIENSESMDLLSHIFPVFFFLIALLVSLTTMTRMVDEQRLQIGTLKALGYSNWAVIKKYLIYGSCASLIGSIIGIIGAHKLLMPIVFFAYSSNFLFKEPLPLLPPIYNLIAVIISLFCTGFVTLVTTRSSLDNNVATLLRPKAPKNGNRVLLERFTLLWRRLSFNYKVTARNIFRYKKRMIMTILGVTGCTALIFMGFAIRDSVTGILGKQYDKLFKYDTILIINDSAPAEDLFDHYNLLKEDKRIASVYPARLEQATVEIPDKLDQDLSIVVPEDEKGFQKINPLIERESQDEIKLNKGAVITEKLASLLDLDISDRLKFKDNDGKFRQIEISGIAENYAGHYLYMTKDYYEEIFEKTYAKNCDYLLLNEKSNEATTQFTQDMLNKDVVLSAINKNVSSDIIRELMKALDIVVLVIILASSLLAMVVLYNLTNINVSERVRELSTIMVLGFYPQEVTAYVYRETMLLTAIGISIGYGFGLLLHDFVLTALPPANIMMDPAVKLSSYILSTALTLAFSLIVMLITHRKLQDIDMVEALKAVE